MELMVKVRIYDDQFAHAPTCNAMPSKHIEWVREGVTPTCFFTGRSLELAKIVDCKTKVGFLVEPRGIRPSIYSGAHLSYLDYIVTFDRQLIAMNPEKILFYPFGCSWIPEADRGIHPKSKLVSMVCSGKTYSEGHRFRNNIYDKFESRFDGYGKYKNPIGNKADALKDYMFSICVQNTKCDDYFTEIIMDCFLTGTVPIFWGTDRIGEYFDDNGIMQFDNMKGLEEILNCDMIDLYNCLSKSIKFNFDKAHEYFSPEDYIFEHYPQLFGGMI
jgi:hypothetical protein